MKSIQIEARWFWDGENTSTILKAAGVKRVHAGWYTVKYNGVKLDASTIISAKRNRKGEINQ